MSAMCCVMSSTLNGRAQMWPPDIVRCRQNPLHKVNENYRIAVTVKTPVFFTYQYIFIPVYIQEYRGFQPTDTAQTILLDYSVAMQCLDYILRIQYLYLLRRIFGMILKEQDGYDFLVFRKGQPSYVIQ